MRSLGIKRKVMPTSSQNMGAAFSMSASARSLLEQSLILHGPFAEQSDSFGEFVAGWREAVINMRRDNWMNQSVEQSALLQLS